MPFIGGLLLLTLLYVPAAAPTTAYEPDKNRPAKIRQANKWGLGKSSQVPDGDPKIKGSARRTTMAGLVARKSESSGPTQKASSANRPKKHHKNHGAQVPNGDPKPRPKPHKKSTKN